MHDKPAVILYARPSLQTSKAFDIPLSNPTEHSFAKAYATVLMLRLDLAGKNDNIGPCLGKTSLSSLTFRGAGAFFTALVFSSTGWRPTALVFTPR